MLGRLHRTTRVDVGLALACSGISYLVWALVAGISRGCVQDMINTIAQTGIILPKPTHLVKITFVDAGIFIDIVGLAWLALSLSLVVLSSRQRFSISWAWVSAILQSFVAALGAVLVGWAIQKSYILLPLEKLQSAPGRTAWETVSGFSLPATLIAAIAVWVAFLIWLLIERAKLANLGPTIRDGLRSNVYR